jgi:putative FmdB family regulatory protein
MAMRMAADGTEGPGLALGTRKCQDVLVALVELPPMPIYEYRCDNDHRFEALQKFSDEPITSCEICGAPAHRVLHPVAIHFKGSGFYSTDYGRGKKAAGDSKSDGGSSTASDSSSKSDSSSSSSSGDSKPAKAAEA